MTSHLSVVNLSITFKVLAHWDLNISCAFKIYIYIYIYMYSSSFLLKMLAADAKKAENRTQSEFFYFYDGRKFWRQCADAIDTMWGCVYFLACNIFWQEFRPQKPFGFFTSAYKMSRLGVQRLNFAFQVNASWFKIFVLENKANTR